MDTLRTAWAGHIDGSTRWGENGELSACSAHRYTSVGGVAPVDLNVARQAVFDVTELTDPSPPGWPTPTAPEAPFLQARSHHARSPDHR